MQTQAVRQAFTITIFWQASHVLGAFNGPTKNTLDGLDEAVSDPAGEFVERHQVVTRSNVRRC
jgi:hypothetical protein